MKRTHERRADIPFRWPEPPFRVVLVEPEIPPNTGNIARLCAATASPLHLVGPLGFRLTNASLRRAGLDYWESVRIFRHTDFDAFLREAAPPRAYLFSTAGTVSYADAAYAPGDALVFGCESKGLPEELLRAYPGQVLGIPMRTEHVRSLNLATAVGIVLYEALRQVDQRPARG